MILNMTGGGAGLNFSVKAYTALPGTGKENEIAVITETPMTDWVLSGTKPTEPSEGMVWVCTGIYSPVTFSLVKNKAVEIHPMRVHQYVGEEWLLKEAKIYQSGEWKDFARYIFHNGVQYIPLKSVGKPQDSTHGESRAPTLTEENGVLKISQPGSKWYCGIVYAETAVDLTGYNTIHVEYSNFTGKGDGDKVYLTVYSAIGSYTESNVIAEKALTTGVTEGTLDVSGISGNHLIALMVQNHSNGSTTMNFYMTGLWLE